MTGGCLISSVLKHNHMLNVCETQDRIQTLNSPHSVNVHHHYYGSRFGHVDTLPPPQITSPPTTLLYSVNTYCMTLSHDDSPQTAQRSSEARSPSICGSSAMSNCTSRAIWKRRRSATSIKIECCCAHQYSFHS